MSSQRYALLAPKHRIFARWQEQYQGWGCSLHPSLVEESDEIVSQYVADMMTLDEAAEWLDELYRESSQLWSTE